LILGGAVSEKKAFHEWESEESSPKVMVQMPTAEAIASAKQISKNAGDDFASAMLQAAGETITIKTFGFSFDQSQSISMKIEDARRLAKWILGHTE
jgi:hypothetical protein